MMMRTETRFRNSNELSRKDFPRGRLLFILPEGLPLRDSLSLLEKVCPAGVGMVQIREKSISSREYYMKACAICEKAKKLGALVFINDRIDIALAVGADGVHLGSEDLAPEVARQILPVDAIIGVTCRNLGEAQAAAKAGADYVAIGSILPSPTKPSAPVVGLERLREVRAAVTLPICAIGGINEKNVSEVLAAGADFVAVISAIATAADPAKAAAALVQAAGV